MPLYNVIVPIVANTEGRDAGEAAAVLEQALERAGFEVYRDYADEIPDAWTPFEAQEGTKPSPLPA